MNEVAEEDLGGGRRRRKRVILIAVMALLVAILLVLWTQRGPIASGFIDRELARRGVEARYDVDQIGFGTERLVNLVIGDPARPDLTAHSVELRLGWSLSGPRLVSIKARGVRLRGRLADGKLTLGQVDRLLPQSSGGPFRLPDQIVDLADAAMGLETDWGRLGIAVEGQGRLSDGFRGRLALASTRLSPAGCRLEGLHANVAVAIDRLRPHLTGPLRAASLACGSAFAGGATRLDLDARLEPALDGWNGRVGVDSVRLRATGAEADRVNGTISFAGNAAETRGRLSLDGRSVRAAESSAARFRLDGPYSLAGNSGQLSFAGTAQARSASLSPSLQAPLLSGLNNLRASPIGPLASIWAKGWAAAAKDLDVDAGLHFTSRDGRGGLRLDRVAASARSGARLALSGGSGLEYRWPAGALRIDGELAIAGGGLPEARFRLRQQRPGGPITGTGRVAPVMVAGTRLALGDIRFSQSGSGTRVDTTAVFDGPVGGGRVAGLVVPIRARIDGDGGFVLGEGCTTIAFRAFQTGTLKLGSTRLPLCPTGRALLWKGRGGALSGGARLSDLRLNGILGASPIQIAADRASFSLADTGFAANGVAIRLGRPESVNRLDVEALAGHASGSGLTGSYSGLSGKLAAVPLRIGEGKGGWHLRGTDLDMDGSIILSDAMEAPRFYPLISRDLRLRLAGNRIEAQAGLGDPKTGTHVADVSIRHELASGKGRALIDLPGIKFDPAYQPEQLTRLTVGVVALVDGTIKGQGEIGWDGAGTTSSGTFSTENMNLAANFGPVEGLSATLHFTDLLNLVSAPGQIATTKVIRTGVDVFDGRIRYRILPGLQVEVEEGRWPFAGGELLLDRTILDFTRPAPKLLTFRLTGMDASRFVTQMEFSNINATGTFDGVVPMIFDDRGGRIEAGHLVARDPGGTLSYVGELTDKDLGVYGKLAFDALKSLRYSKLVVDLDGSLEGEFVAGIQLDGIARNVSAAPAAKGGLSAMVVGRALGQLAKIPFKFNISVRGPFRAVIGTARSLEDPTNLIQSVLPEMLRGKAQANPPVQPKESEPVR